MTDKMRQIILDEILRISAALYKGLPDEGCSCGNCKTNMITLFGYCINRLAMVLNGDITISDFHDGIANAPQKVRTFYIKLLFEEK